MKKPTALNLFFNVFGWTLGSIFLCGLFFVPLEWWVERVYGSRAEGLSFLLVMHLLSTVGVTFGLFLNQDSLQNYLFSIRLKNLENVEALEKKAEEIRLAQGKRVDRLLNE